MTVIGYRLVGDRRIKLFEVHGTEADERSKLYLLNRGIPVDEDYITEHMRSNFYFLLIKVHEDGTTEIIDTAYHMRKGTYQGRPIGERIRRDKRMKEKKAEIDRKLQELRKRREREVESIKNLATPEGITVKELKERVNLLSLLQAIKLVRGRYQELWKKEPLVYADAYISFLESVGDWYAERYRKQLAGETEDVKGKDMLEAWLIALEGDDYYIKKATGYYDDAAGIATSVAIIYFPEQNYPEEATRYFERAIELADKIESLAGPSEDHWIYFNNLGTHYYEMEKSEKAIPVLYRALKYAKNSEVRSPIYHNLALCYADIGNKELAIGYMVRSICLHHETQTRYSDVSLYDKDIERIVDMTDEPLSDAAAIKIALDLLGGNLTRSEACRQLSAIDREKWPLSRALWEVLCSGVAPEKALRGVPEECKSLILEVSDRFPSSS